MLTSKHVLKALKTTDKTITKYDEVVMRKFATRQGCSTKSRVAVYKGSIICLPKTPVFDGSSLNQGYDQ